MAEVVTDERVAAVLRPFVRATAPVLEFLREADPLRLRNRFRPGAGTAEPGAEKAAAGAAGLAGYAEEDAAGNERSTVDSSKIENDESGRRTLAEDQGAGKSVPGDSATGDEDQDSVRSRDPTEFSEDAADAGKRSADRESEEPPEHRAETPEENAEQAGTVERVLRQLDGMQLPGSSTWDTMTLGQRCDWWAGRVGRFLALLAGLPRFGGMITSRLPIRNALGLVGQGLVLSAIAAEHGMTSRGEQVRLIAKVVLDRELSTAVASGESGESRGAEDARTAELTEEIDSSARRNGKPTGRAVARTVWRMARILWEIHSELDKRPQGRFYHEVLGSIPVVGVVGGYLGERSALREIARDGSRWIRRKHPTAE